jgi:hypothetical protein
MNWHPSPEHADWWYQWTSIGLLSFAVIIAIFSMVQHWASGVRDRRAEAQIAEAKKDSAIANQASNEAKKDAAIANQASEALKLQSREVELALERERVSRLQLEAAVAPRTMTAEQRAAVVAAWRRFAGRHVSVSSYALDAEAALLGQQLIGGLRDAGLNVVEALTTVVPIGGLSLGVHVTAGADRALAHGLAEAIGQNTSTCGGVQPASASRGRSDGTRRVGWPATGGHDLGWA